jgi:hypothetical protein
MKRLIAAIAALAVALATVAFAATAQADPSEYGIESTSAEASTAQAGAHPDFTVSLGLNTDPEGKLPSATKDLRFDLPPGLLANPGAAPKCTAAQLITTDINDKSNNTGCPQDSQVGVTEVELFVEGNLVVLFEPIYNMEPRYGEPARFGFIGDVYPIFIDTELRPDREYAATAKVEGVSSLIPLRFARSTFWGVPGEESHDAQRITAYEAVHNNGSPETPNGKRPASLPPIPYMLNPTRCGQSQGIGITAIPYALPDLEVKAFAPLIPNTGCSLLDFEPNLSIAPTTSQAESGSGLDVNLTFPTDGLEHPNLLGEAEQRKAEVTLPEGVTINPSEAAGGLGVCSPSDFAKETASSLPNEGCPDTSKIGTVTATSPLVNETAEGGLFLAKPYENPFGSLLAIYLVLKIPDRGVVVKLAGKVEPDPRTGQLITTFDEIPQLPVASFHLHFREGARSPLVTPPRCGRYESTAVFTSWAGQVITTHPSFQISSGVGGGPCPGASQSFKPEFEAGTLNNAAGSHSPFEMRLTRRDGEQDMTKFSSTLPPGVLASLVGVGKCPDSAIAAARARTGPHGGQEELDRPSCPATSQIGTTLAGAGVGQVLTYAPGKVYLAGPYHGSLLSVVAITAGVAGPFDVGAVVVQEALNFNPRTAQAQADGSASDPIPHILKGIPLKVRDLRVHIDRPNWTFNPTSCAPSATLATLWGGGSDVFSSADDVPVGLQARFQAADCANLAFKPSLKLNLKGAVKRGGFPALRAAYRPRAGDANVGGMVVRLPHSAFLEQGHFRTICTRVQFAAHACPPASQYGSITAYTPLLEEPLQGPVYLRSSNHNLPDLVFDLHGLVDVEVSARIDSAHGGIRATLEELPDAPITKVLLTMQGGQKGLIVNSTNLCASTNRAQVDATGQNGKLDSFAPALRPSCGGKHQKRRGHKKR